MPEEPLSLTHWLDSFGTVMAGYGAYQAGKNIPTKRKTSHTDKVSDQV